MEGGEGMGFLRAIGGRMGIGVAVAVVVGEVLLGLLVVSAAAAEWPSVDERSDGPPPALPVVEKGRW